MAPDVRSGNASHGVARRRPAQNPGRPLGCSREPGALGQLGRAPPGLNDIPPPQPASPGTHRLIPESDTALANSTRHARTGGSSAPANDQVPAAKRDQSRPPSWREIAGYSRVAEHAGALMSGAGSSRAWPYAVPVLNIV
jgi:hypothetical protein